MRDERAQAIGSAALAGAVVGVAVFAPIDRVGALEARAFRAVNGLPDALHAPVWALMQSGSLGVVPAASLLALATGRRRTAAAIATAGTSAYVLARVAKRFSGRPRPARLLDDVRERGRPQGGTGLPSGHAAVSAAIVSAALPAVPRRWRPLVAAAAVTAPFGRVYVGAHLPLDTVAGSALGIALGRLAAVAFGQGEGLSRGTARPRR